MSATCRSCGAPVKWCVTEKGRAIPLNPAPSPNGNLVILEGDPRDAPTVRYATTADREREKWTTHFTDCVDAKAWRGGR